MSPGSYREAWLVAWLVSDFHIKRPFAFNGLVSPSGRIIDYVRDYTCVHAIIEKIPTKLELHLS